MRQRLPRRMRLRLHCSHQAARPSSPTAAVTSHHTPPLPGRGVRPSGSVPTIRPICLPPYSVNQSAPSGPALIPAGAMYSEGRGKSLSWPLAVIRILSATERLSARPRWNSARSAARGRRRKGEVAQLATGGDPPNGIAIELGEPQRPIRPRRDPPRKRVGRRVARPRHVVLAYLAAGGDPSNLIAFVLSEPERAVRPCRDPR